MISMWIFMLASIYVKLVAFVIAVGVILLVIKLARSPKFDKLCNDLAEGKLDNDATTKDQIKDITKTRVNLGKQADQNTKEATKLQKESEGINEFLGNGGKNITEKGEGS